MGSNVVIRVSDDLDEYLLEGYVVDYYTPELISVRLMNGQRVVVNSNVVSYLVPKQNFKVKDLVLYSGILLEVKSVDGDVVTAATLGNHDGESTYYTDHETTFVLVKREV